MKFHFLENDETAKDMTWFLIGDDEAKAKCRFFVASLDNFKISVESQLRKSPNRFFLFNKGECWRVSTFRKVV